jgi:hypothetical protein
MSTPMTPSAPDRFRPSNTSPSRSTSTTQPRRPERARIRVEGIGSAFDADRLERRLQRMVGVLGVNVNSITEYAAIAYDPGLTSPSMLVKQIEFSGFRATVR